MATLLYRWRFDEGSGQYAYDAAAGIAAKMYESAEWDRGVQWDSAGYNGACLKGNGATVAPDDWATMGALVQTVTWSTPPTNFTYTLWYKTSTKQDRVLLCINKDTADRDVGLNQSLQLRRVGSIQTVDFHYWPPAGGSSVLTSIVTDPGITNGQWHFVAVTGDGTNTKLYWDDCEAPVDTNTTVSRATTGTFRMRIGGGYDAAGVTSGTFSGLIDDARVYNGALTADEICAVKTDFINAIANAIMFSCNT